MSKTEQILTAAEAVFYREGFRGTGIDRVIAAAGVTPRTLYRHFRSKDDLARAALRYRETRYHERFEADVERHAVRCGDPLLAVIDALADWLKSEGDQGCMFLKALGEYGEHEPDVAEVARAQKRRALDDLRRRVAAAGLDSNDGLPERLLVLMEGATALAPVLGAEAAAAHARAAAEAVLRVARGEAGR